MKILFQKLYLASLFEVLALCLFLLWTPSEGASQFLFGRSLFRWIVATPAILIFVLGVITYGLYVSGRITINHFNGKEEFKNVMGKDSVAMLLLVDFIFLALFILCGGLSYQLGLTAWFIRLMPWFVFISILLAQYNYWVIMGLRGKGESLDLRTSILRMPNLLRTIIFDQHEGLTRSNRLVEDRLYWIAVSCLICVFLLVGYFFVKFAGLNSDEGWYLYAARQVYLGQRPYQDFAFTQMPLLPYIYGVGLLFRSSVYTGRLTSLIIYSSSVYLLFLISNKYFNRETFIWLLLVIVVNSEAFYFNTIVKTYSLTLFFFLLSLYLWLSSLKAEIKYSLMFSALLLGFLTRLPFAFYAFFVVIKIAFETLKLKNRFSIFLTMFVVNLPIILAGLYFLYPNPRNAVWNVYTYNAGIHGLSFSINMVFEYIAHLQGYFRSVKIFWPVAIPLIFAVMAGIYYRRFKQEKLQTLLVVAFAVFMFLSVHFLGGGPMYEYYVPATTFLLGLLIWFLFSFSEVKSGINLFILWTSRAALTAVVITLIYTGRFGSYNYEYYHGHPPVETIRKIAEVVNQYYPGQPIFTLEALYVATEADRDVPPGMSMAQFSVLDLPADEAEKLHFINYTMMEDILASEDTKILVLNQREVDSLQDIIQNDYTQVFEIDDFGQKSIKAYVFIRNK